MNLYMVYLRGNTKKTDSDIVKRFTKLDYYPFNVGDENSIRYNGFCIINYSSNEVSYTTTEISFLLDIDYKGKMTDTLEIARLVCLQNERELKLDDIIE